MQIDGLSSVPPVISISSSQQIDGPISRASYQSSESAAYGQGISTRQTGVRPLVTSPATAKRKSSFNDSDPNDHSLSEIESSRIDGHETMLGSLVDEIA